MEKNAQRLRERIELATTRWSLLHHLSGRRSKDPLAPRSRAASDELLRRYGAVIYRFFRSRFNGGEQAADSAHDFVELVLLDPKQLDQLLVRVDAEPVVPKGRFRAWLFMRMRWFAGNQHAQRRSERRARERGFAARTTSAHLQMPDEQRPVWHKTTGMMQRALDELRTEYCVQGDMAKDLFEDLTEHLAGPEWSTTSFRELVAKHALHQRWKEPESALRVAVTKMRAEYRVLFCKELYRETGLRHPSELWAERTTRAQRQPGPLGG